MFTKVKSSFVHQAGRYLCARSLSECILSALQRSQLPQTSWLLESRDFLNTALLFRMSSRTLLDLILKGDTDPAG